MIDYNIHSNNVDEIIYFLKKISTIKEKHIIAINNYDEYDIYWDYELVDYAKRLDIKLIDSIIVTTKENYKVMILNPEEQCEEFYKDVIMKEKNNRINHIIKNLKNYGYKISLNNIIIRKEIETFDEIYRIKDEDIFFDLYISNRMNIDKDFIYFFRKDIDVKRLYPELNEVLNMDKEKIALVYNESDNYDSITNNFNIIVTNTTKRFNNYNFEVLYGSDKNINDFVFI